MKRMHKIDAIMSFFVISLFLFLASPSQAYYSLATAQSSVQSYAQPYYSSPSPQSYYSLPSINININFYGFPGSNPYYSQPASQYGAYYYLPGYAYPPNSQYYSPQRYPASSGQPGGFAMGNSQYYSGYGYSPSQPYGTGYPYGPGYQTAPATSRSSFDPSSPYGFGYDPFASASPLTSNPYQQMQSQFKDTDISISYSNKGDNVNLHAGETLSIVLPSNPDAGCKWYLDTDKLDSKIIAKESDEFFPGYPFSSSTAFGFTGAHDQWIFKAIAPGTTVVRLEIKESESSRALDVYEVEVTVAD
ncbi:MAG: protease inhibitor I42 family protein [bacterium]